MSNLKNARRSLVILYCIVQAVYWTGYCCIGTYAAVYLHAHDYTNAQLGLILALGNIGGFFLAPVLASIIDRSKKITVFHCLFILLIIEGILELILALLSCDSILIGFVFCILMVLTVAINPLNIDMCFALDHSGKYINYGTARAFGSLAFAFVSMALGHLCTSRSADILPVAGSIMVLLQIIVLLMVISVKNKYINNKVNDDENKPEDALSLIDFISQNKRFIVFCIGLCLLNFSGSIIGNYQINVIENLGGNSANMGTLSCLCALSEVPIMILYTRITRNIKCSHVIRVASFMYIVKAVFFMVAPSVQVLYLSCIIQAFSYALLTPAIVDYTSIVIKYSDMAKGQSVSAAMLTLGTVFASQLGGILLDKVSVYGTLFAGAVICALGTFICFLSVDKSRA